VMITLSRVQEQQGSGTRIAWHFLFEHGIGSIGSSASKVLILVKIRMYVIYVVSASRICLKIRLDSQFP